MILLESENVIIRDVLADRFAKPSSVDQTFTDFDGVAYHIESTKAGPLTLSMDVKCWEQLRRFGAEELLQREYGTWLRSAPPEPEYNLTLEIDYAKLPQDPAALQALIRSLSLLKRNVMAAPFERAFELHKALESHADATANLRPGDQPPALPAGAQDVMAVNYRDDEAIYIVPGADRVTVVFSTVFQEETDRILGKVFLQEFVDARRLPALQNAPQVLYSTREPPLEIRSIPGLNRSENVGYVTFVLFPRHFANQEVRNATISHMIHWRSYFHYHLKASKAYLHSRLRHRVAEFLKVLNRARPENSEKERKTASGRTFRSRA